MLSDVTLQIRLFAANEGGRQSDITGQFYACPILVDDEAFDCRMYLPEEGLKLGQTYIVPVKFLNPDLVLPKLIPGKEVGLWEGKQIGTGSVVSVTGQ
jgi:hypothetical protein